MTRPSATPPRADAPPPKPGWHTLSLPALLEDLGTSGSGLSTAEARARRATAGPNVLPTAPPTTLAQVIGRQFLSPLIYILAAAAVVSVLIGETTDALFIALVLGINAAIGSWQEWKAEKGTRALQKLLQVRAVVVRDGHAQEIPAENVVPGDVVLLESGHRVPADLRLLESNALEVDESLLTGESVPVSRDPRWTGPEAAPIGDRRNMSHAATFVVRGRGRGIVVGTGNRTVVGQLAKDVLGASASRPPLLVRMERFSHVVAWVTLVAAVIVGALAVLLRGLPITESFLLVVALAVSAIPEGLPVAMTVALAVATARMVRRNVVVRRLAAVEGLGSCTLIASDKTGTLTCNELTVRELRLPDGRRFEVTGQGYAPEGEILQDGRSERSPQDALLGDLLRAGVLCNEATLAKSGPIWTWQGDPTDVALLSAGVKGGVDRATILAGLPQVDQIPFEPENRYAATFHGDAPGTRAFVKGAPEQVLAMCVIEPTTEERLRQEARAMAAQGLRVLAFAEGPAGTAGAGKPPSGLRFLGFAGMNDPLRPGVREAVAQCAGSGIRVCMVTGDHPLTALAIARDLGFARDSSEVVTGPDLEKVGPEERRALVDRARVFARVAPGQKLELVKAAQEAGHFVAVTGDGVNDAPALRQAHIGVAMGKAGTDVAREAAELVLADDNFASIVAGVEEGRVAYDNIRKVIYLLISTGAAEVLMVGLAVASGMPLPLLPVQLLWLNLVTNGIQGVALAFEPNEGGVMARAPRPPAERIFNRLMIERTLIGVLVMGGVSFGAFASFIEAGWSEADARNAILLLMVLFENVHIGNCRSETRSALVLSPFRSPILLTGTLAAFGVHLAAMHLPFAQKVLSTAPVSPSLWALLVPLALTVFLALEIHKLTWALRRKRRSEPAN